MTETLSEAGRALRQLRHVGDGARSGWPQSLRGKPNALAGRCRRGNRLLPIVPLHLARSLTG